MTIKNIILYYYVLDNYELDGGRQANNDDVKSGLNLVRYVSAYEISI